MSNVLDDGFIFLIHILYIKLIIANIFVQWMYIPHIRYFGTDTTSSGDTSSAINQDQRKKK